jgi:hypothetical protein
LACLLNRDAASFERAAQNLLRTTDVRISAELLRRVVESEGRRVLACCDDGRLDPQWGAQQCRTTTPTQGQGPSRIYLGCDGFTAQLITHAEKLKRRAGVKHKRRRRGRRTSASSVDPCRPLPRLKRGTDQKFREFKLVTFYD